MTREARLKSGIILISVPTIQYGRLFPAHLADEQELWIHGQSVTAGSLSCRPCARWCDCALVIGLPGIGRCGTLPDSVLWLARVGVPVAGILMPLGFFLSMPLPSSTRPNSMVGFVYPGGVVPAASVVTLGIGLIRGATS